MKATLTKEEADLVAKYSQEVGHGMLDLAENIDKAEKFMKLAADCFGRLNMSLTLLRSIQSVAELKPTVEAVPPAGPKTLPPPAADPA